VAGVGGGGGGWVACVCKEKSEMTVRKAWRKQHTRGAPWHVVDRAKGALLNLVS